jgi:hypothetical protein
MLITERTNFAKIRELNEPVKDQSMHINAVADVYSFQQW